MRIPALSPLVTGLAKAISVFLQVGLGRHLDDRTVSLPSCYCRCVDRDAVVGTAECSNGLLGAHDWTGTPNGGSIGMVPASSHQFQSTGLWIGVFLMDYETRFFVGCTDLPWVGFACPGMD